jgi:hypothetical protein
MSRTKYFLAGLAIGIFCLTTSLRAQRITAVWQGQQLGMVLERLAATRDAPLWIDRRVDPQQTLDVKFSDVPLSEALATIAAQRGLGVAQFDELIYVGPERTTRGLATLARRVREQVARIPVTQRRRWLRVGPSDWPRLTQPRALLKQLLRQADVELVAGELIPHDLWQARQLPPMALVDRVVLVLAGFDLNCEISRDGKTCRVVRIEFPLPAAGAAPLAEARLPVRSRARTLRQEFSLRLENQPVGRVMEQLAGQLKLELSWDENSLHANKQLRETLVSCRVTKVELDELLSSILEPAGLGFTKEGHRVEIFAAPQ